MNETAFERELRFVVIAYDVVASDFKYEQLYRSIHELSEGECIQMLLSVWLVYTGLDTEDILNTIQDSVGVDSLKIAVLDWHVEGTHDGLSQEVDDFVNARQNQT